MHSAHISWQGKLARTCPRFLLLLAGVCLLPKPLDAQTRQRETEPTIKTGKLVEVTRKGRVQMIKFTDDAGEQRELIITPKMHAEVQATGDAGFLQPGQFIAAIATESNQMLFIKEISVILFGNGRPPRGRIVKAPPRPGQSMNAYQVTGTINAIGPHPDFPDNQQIAIKAAGPRVPIMLEKEFQVTVKSGDLSLAPKDTPVEISGTELRNGRFNPVKVSLKLADPLKAEDVLGAEKDKPEK